eukprot:gene1960-3806_t
MDPLTEEIKVVRKRRTTSEKRAYKRQCKREFMKLKRKAQREKRHIKLLQSFDSEESRNLYWATIKAERERQQEFMKTSMSNGQRICISLDFTKSESTEQECNSLRKQICLTYNSLKQSPVPVSLHLCSPTPILMENLTKYNNVSNWPVTFHEKPVWETFPIEDIVMLSPDAEDVLLDIDPNKEFIPDRKSSILSMDRVFTILWEFIQIRDWRVVLEAVIPARKRVGLVFQLVVPHTSVVRFEIVRGVYNPSGSLLPVEVDSKVPDWSVIWGISFSFSETPTISVGNWSARAKRITSYLRGKTFVYFIVSKESPVMVTLECDLSSWEDVTIYRLCGVICNDWCSGE